MRLKRFSPYILGLLVLIVLPLLVPDYIDDILTSMLIYAIFAMSLDILMGYTGLMSLGHAAFFGVGGYGVAIFIDRLGIESFWIVAPVGIVLATIMAAILGIIALRVSGIYFLLVTFALSMTLEAVANKWRSLTHGIVGLANLPKPVLGIPNFQWDSTNFYYFILIALIICYFLMYRFVHSPFGSALQGIRESETRMQALGYNTWFYKYIAFIVSGLFAGVAGVLFAHYNSVISPYHFNITVSALAMLFCIAGGLGTLWGSLIGVALIQLVQYFASIYAPYRWPLILGGVFILTVMFFRGGFAPVLTKLWNKVIWKHSELKV